MYKILKLSDEGKELLGVYNNDITHLTIPNGVTSIGYEAFADCKLLKCIEIPDSVTSINDCAFIGCESLQSINIPSSVAYIGGWVFAGCISLQRITVSEDNQTYSSFNGSLFDVDRTRLIRAPFTIQEYVIPNGVTSIDDFAFDDCSLLESIVIPDSIVSIGSCAFACCKSLRSIQFCKVDVEQLYISESAFTSIEGILGANTNDLDLNYCILYIPPGTRMAYKRHPILSEFRRIYFAPPTIRNIL